MLEESEAFVRRLTDQLPEDPAIQLICDLDLLEYLCCWEWIGFRSDTFSRNPNYAIETVESEREIWTSEGMDQNIVSERLIYVLQGLLEFLITSVGCIRLFFWNSRSIWTYNVVIRKGNDTQISVLIFASSRGRVRNLQKGGMVEEPDTSEELWYHPCPLSLILWRTCDVDVSTQKASGKKSKFSPTQIWKM